MSSQIEDISESVTTTIKDLEVKIEKIIKIEISALATTTEKTFASTVKESNQKETPTSLRAIIKEAKNTRMTLIKKRDTTISLSLVFEIETRQVKWRISRKIHLKI